MRTSIELLDLGGESGLTFRHLSDRLVTGPGAIYGHVVDKDDLLAAACDEIVAGMLAALSVGETPEGEIRALALGLFDTIDRHPWVGPVLTRASGQPSMMRVVERLGRAILTLGVPPEERWIFASTLLSYILGVAGQNAANGQIARVHGLERTRVLAHLADRWERLDPEEYPFVRGIARSMREHDDRADFLAGIEIILRGIGAETGI